jgi:hypothetical protein
VRTLTYLLTLDSSLQQETMLLRRRLLKLLQVGCMPHALVCRRGVRRGAGAGEGGFGGSARARARAGGGGTEGHGRGS